MGRARHATVDSWGAFVSRRVAHSLNCWWAQGSHLGEIYRPSAHLPRRAYSPVWERTSVGGLVARNELAHFDTRTTAPLPPVTSFPQQLKIKGR